MGKWRVKTSDETDPTVPSHVKNITSSDIANWNASYGRGNPALPEGLEGSIQTKSGNNFAGTKLGINEGLINNLSFFDVGFKNNNYIFRITPEGQAEHRHTNNHWNFRSSLSDTTFYVRNRIRFDQPSTNYQLSINTNNSGKMSLVTKSGNSTAQISLLSGTSSQRGVNLVSLNADRTSQIGITDAAGISLVSKNTKANVTNDLTLNSDKTNFYWTDNNGKTREFNLNDGTMSFKTMQGTTVATNFYVNSNSLRYSIANSYFDIGDNLFYFRPKVGSSDYFTYSITEKLLRLKDAIMFVTDDLSAHPGPRISMTNDYDLKFSRFTPLPSKSITLTEIIQKGQIIKQTTEPTIPDESFAFWVNGATFYLILKSGNIQKKLQLQ
jgi:hypothetical protein